MTAAQPAHPAPPASLRQRLRQAGLRPTRQRLALAELLLHQDHRGHRHITAEVLAREAALAGIEVSLATVYNTLHQFTAAGLLRRVAVASERAWFDTNTQPHHHFFDTARQQLTDIPTVAVGTLPRPPAGTRIQGVELVIQLAPDEV